ncbi:MAG: hypothetical protein GXO91_00930, partial [FCB group bacterium]|nr:hypothetical protein [FCB group bacterium]
MKICSLIFVTVMFSLALPETNPHIFQHNTSTIQARYFIGSASIDGEELTTDDWIGAYYQGKCVGSARWMGTYADLIIMGDDGTVSTSGYALENVPLELKFHIADGNYLYPAVPTEEIIFLSGTTTPVQALTSREQDRQWYVRGNKFHDLNCNGYFDQDEFYNDIQINLYYPAFEDPANLIASTVTQTDPYGNWGYYEFLDIPGTPVLLTETIPQGWYQSLPGPYFNNQWIVNEYQSGEYFDFGNCDGPPPTTPIQGEKWNDIDGDGTMDSNEP